MFPVMMPGIRAVSLVSLALLLAASLLFAGCDNVAVKFDPATGKTTITTTDSNSSTGNAPAAAVTDVPGSGYLFCFWNVENLFDDVDNGLKSKGDEEYDTWFAQNPHILKFKLDKLAQAILSLNGGKGPDILAMVEVENVRAAQLLQATLNQKLDPTLHYTNLVMEEVRVGRHIAPVILTRLPVTAKKTRSLDKRYRIVQTAINVNGRELHLIASHWTSRLRDTSEGQRAKYADKIYGACNAIYHANPAADILICGDFNDTPQDKSVVEHLYAVNNRMAFAKGGPHLRLLDLMGSKNPSEGFGTYYYRDWDIFDHIVVSPGMLDNQAWTYDPESVRTVNNLVEPGEPTRRPWRFGGPDHTGSRGYSDHFPVAVRLQVN